MYSNKAPKDSGADAVDSDEEVKKANLVKDKRLLFVNKLDSAHFESKEESKEVAPDADYSNRDKGSKLRGLNQDTDVKLPIVFHEREIMENIENNVATIVCGETGSGKSTQIPQFIYKAAKAMAWKYRGGKD